MFSGILPFKISKHYQYLFEHIIASIVNVDVKQMKRLNRIDSMTYKHP